MGRRPHGAFPAMRWHSKGYWFCRATDPTTGKRRDFILGADKSEAERKYEVLKAKFELRHAEQVLNRNNPQSAILATQTTQIIRPALS